MIPPTSLTLSIIDKEVNSMPLDEEFAQRGSLQLKYNGSDDRHQYLMTSELVFSMEVSDAATLNFDHLFTGNESRYEVQLTNQDDAIIWRGYILPEQYEEPFEHALLYVNFTATDGIARLKGKTLPAHMYQDRYSVIRFIQECLKLTNLEQDLLFAPAIKNDSDLIGSDWTKILIDGSTYESSSGDQRDCYEILEQLMETLGCSLFTYLGQWYITGHNRYIVEDGQTNVIQYYKYTAAGDAAGFVDLVVEPNTINLEGTPQITLIPPLQKAAVTWDLKEPTNILPENIIVQPYETFAQWQNPPVIQHWVTSSGALGVRRVTLNDVRIATSSAFGFSLSADEIERRREIVNSVQYVGLNNFALTLPSNINHYMELEQPIYLKSVPDYIDVSITLVGKFVYVDNSGPFPEVDEDFWNNDHLNYAIFYDGEMLISNHPTYANRDAYLLDINYEGENMISQTRPKRIVGDIQLENMQLPYPGGELQVRIYAGAGVDNNIKIVSTGCRVLSIKYSADQSHVYNVTRAIDWTTDLEVDITHGGSVNDIGTSHFTLQNGDDNASNYTAYDVIGTQQFALGFIPPVTVYDYIEVSAATYAALQTAVSNGTLIYGLPLNQSVYKLIKTDYSAVFQFEMFKTQGSQYYVYLEYVDGAAFNYFNIGPTLFKDGLFIYNTTVAAPDIDRSFRELWSRVNAPVINEGIRYGRARAQMIQDTQPQELVKIDSTIFGLLDPWSLKRFNVKGFKNFIVTDLSLALDEGMSTATLVQVVHDNEVVTTYELDIEE